MTKFGANRFGAFYATVDGNNITKVENFNGDKAPTSLNTSLLDITNNQTRIGYAYVRKSYLQNNGKPCRNELRGKEPFVRVSWETALNLAANALQDNFTKFGPSSIYGECYHWGGSGKVSWGRTCVHRMLNLLGGYVNESGDYSTGAGIVLMPYVLGDTAVYNMPVRLKAVIKNAKNVVLWAANPVVTNQTALNIPTHDHEPLMRKLRDCGAKIYSVNVMRNESSKFFNANDLLIRPNTDTAMILAMCHYLYINGLYDKNFILNYTYGFEKFLDNLLGVNDGIAKTTQWASDICGIDCEVIENFAKQLANEPTLIIVGRALQRSHHGEQSYWAVVALSCMLGYIGKEGLGFEFSLGYMVARGRHAK
jgi:trimethylamiNe-n-oxide reductase 1